MPDTIFAVSSGAPPAAIAVVRVSGDAARSAVSGLCGKLPEPRKASLRTLRSKDGEILDTALVLVFPHPSTATGEDLIELHCHGGRAVVRAVEEALASQDGVRAAQPGEFTRRAFANGRMDLAEAEALADLLSAETELQRRAAQAGFGGAISETVRGWRTGVLQLSAELEAVLDFSDEEDAGDLPAQFFTELSELGAQMGAWLDRPSAERLRDGVRIVLAGPPNSGKSSLFNVLLETSAAITSAEAGTTRDVIERPVAIGGVPIVLVDTAGLRGRTSDAIEAEGIERAEGELSRADIVLWLGDEGQGPDGAIEIAARCDADDAARKVHADFAVSSVTGEGVDALKAGLVERAARLLPKPGEAALNARQRAMVSEASEALAAIDPQTDWLIIGENLRRARLSFDRLLGRASTEDMLDTLFGQFCIGK